MTHKNAETYASHTETKVSHIYIYIYIHMCNSEAGVDTSVVSLFSDADFVVLVCSCVISMFAIRYSMFFKLRISAV